MKDSIILWIHVCDILEPYDGAESCWRLHDNPWKCLSAQGSKWDFKMSETYHSEFNFTLEGTKTSRNLPDGVTAAQIITDCGYWRFVTILSLTELEEPQTRSFCWLTTCYMSNFFSSVNTKLGSVPWSISSRIWRLLSILILLWCSVSSWRWSILQVSLSRSSFINRYIVELLTFAWASSFRGDLRGLRSRFSRVFLTACYTNLTFLRLMNYFRLDCGTW